MLVFRVRVMLIGVDADGVPPLQTTKTSPTGDGVYQRATQ
jgi:hypothetical protein